jgi:hypothetical protein
LLVVTCAIFWIVIAPQVDLDPATPLNIEALFFAIVALALFLTVSSSGTLNSRRLAPWTLAFPRLARCASSIASHHCASSAACANNGEIFGGEQPWA